jgi:hypothetical protein
VDPTLFPSQQPSVFSTNSPTINNHKPRLPNKVDNTWSIVGGALLVSSFIFLGIKSYQRRQRSRNYFQTSIIEDVEPIHPHLANPTLWQRFVTVPAFLLSSIASLFSRARNVSVPETMFTEEQEQEENRREIELCKRLVKETNQRRIKRIEEASLVRVKRAEEIKKNKNTKQSELESSHSIDNPKLSSTISPSNAPRNPELLTRNSHSSKTFTI